VLFLRNQQAILIIPNSCNLYIQGSVATIIAKKVGNQSILYFPTSPS